MPGSLQDTNVLVIGGSSGMGLATAQMAKAAGANVTIAGRDEERLAAASQELGGVPTFAVDVADEHGIKQLFDSLDRVDHVSTFAGTHVVGAVADLDIDALSGPVASRFWGPIHIFKYAPPKMTSGSITLCTGAGVARPGPRRAIAAAASGGSEVFSRAMAVELAPIRVNVVAPGAIETPMLHRMAGDRLDEVLEQQAQRIPLGRVGRPDEIAHAAVFLMTNEYVTGVTLAVDGGFVLV